MKLKVMQALFLLLQLLVFSCKKETTNPQPENPLIGGIQCEAAQQVSEFFAGEEICDTIMVPCSDVRQGSYPQGDSMVSSGVSGLWARILPGTFTESNHSVRMMVKGKASLPGIAFFDLNFAGKSCQLSLRISDPDTIAWAEPFTQVPGRQDVVIYQVNMRIFSSSGNFQGVINRLDSIKKMGANVIYLMPIYPLGISRGINSPYCVRNYREVNPEFGNLQQLRSLVDAAHQRGMALILDWVANHTAWDHSWINLHRDWYLQDASGNIRIPPGTNWQDVAQLNFSKNEMRLEMIRSMKYWVYQANIDGFRCDYADGPPFDFWRQAIDSLRKIPGRKLLMLAEGSRNNHFVAGFDFTFGFNFFNSLKTIYANSGSAVSLNGLNVSEFSASSNQQQVVRYTSNHDVNGSDGTPIELFQGKEGSLGAFAIAALMKGIPMIYGGQEAGLPYRLTFPFTGANIDWSLNPDLQQKYRKIISFRNNSTAIRNAEPQLFSTADVVAFSKEWQGEKVLVLVNVRNSSKSIATPEGWVNQNCSDVLSGNQITLSSSVELGPLGIMILKTL